MKPCYRCDSTWDVDKETERCRQCRRQYKRWLKRITPSLKETGLVKLIDSMRLWGEVD
jgi:hypothetical protein